MESEEPPIIPFGGGGRVILPENMAGFIKEEDKIPLALAISLYTNPLEVYEDWTMVDNRTRVAAWKNGDQYIIGCRGTQLDQQDLSDDKVRTIQ